MGSQHYVPQSLLVHSWPPDDGSGRIRRWSYCRILASSVLRKSARHARPPITNQGLQMGDSAIVRTHRAGIDLIPAVLSIGVLNVATDFWVLLLPIPKLITLESITKQRRMWICIVFLLGFVVTVCSMVRFTTILPLRNTTNATWDFGHFVIWSEVEIHLSMVSCNLPALAGLIHRLRWRHRRRIASQGEEDQQPSGIARSNATKQASVTNEMFTADDDLYEDSNGKIVRREKEAGPAD